MNGILVVDKPSDWTSHDVVAKMRGIAKTRSVGHLGTLDPIATGVLPLILGNATRLARFYTKVDKSYEATIRFGHSTDTYDRAGKATSPDLPPPQLAAIEEAACSFSGPIAQMPPQYSAKKVNGVAAYESARRNIAVDLKPVAIEIFEFRILGYDAPDLRALVKCSSGTYVRSIAHDLGAALGCGGYIQELRRLSSGEFRIDHARTLDQLQILSNEGRMAEALLPSVDLLPDFPNIFVDPITAGQIRQGRDFNASPFRERRDAEFVKAIEGSGTLIAIGEAKMPNIYHPIVVLVN